MPLQLISISLPKLFTGKKCPYPQTQYPVKRFSTIFLREKQRFADYGQVGKNKGPLNREGARFNFYINFFRTDAETYSPVEGMLFVDNCLLHFLPPVTCYHAP